MSKIQFWKQFTTRVSWRFGQGRLYSICQRYNFESNLQPFHLLCRRNHTVFDMSKIQFWKQFTTGRWRGRIWSWLYSICQRYNFESNLQRCSFNASLVVNCIRYVKDTILKAIYNGKTVVYETFTTVFDMSKIQFWKQFTTTNDLKRCLRNCIRYVKDTILKAIYNERTPVVFCFITVFDMSKIQFWKQFTTPLIFERGFLKLYSICQRYNFESNLQLLCACPFMQLTVFDMSKIQFWKQFTTSSM